MVKCVRCILDSDQNPELTFGEKGECSFCKIHDKLESDNPISPSKLIETINRIKSEGKGRKYDCIVGVSGGCDSSYLLNLCVENGLRPLAVHWDNNWNTEIAKENIGKITNKLFIDLVKVGVNRREYDDICRSFLLASTCDADIANDIALTTTLLKVAKDNECHFVLDAHNFRTEGTAPISWSYMDGKYIESVHKQFGKVQMKTYPNLWLENWLEYLINFPIERPRLLYHVDYDKEEAKRFLTERFGWQWYGGHHMENKYTIFIGNYLHPRKFGIDLRWIEFSALIRSGQMGREEAFRGLEKPPYTDTSILREVERRLNIDIDEIMALPKKTHNDYETYQQTFRNLEPVFSILHRMGRIPSTFYLKYVEGV